MSVELDGLVDRFLAAFRHRLEASRFEEAAIGAEIGALQAVWPAQAGSRAVAPARLPACGHLAFALDCGYAGLEASLASAIAALAPALRWTYSYPVNPLDQDLSSKVAFAQIVGAKGLRPSGDMHVGLTLIAPNVVYPAHAHPAVELYLVVAGTAAWQNAEGAAVRKPPGDLIVHPSNVVHAMTTFEEPLLAIWTWRGDLESPSVYVGAATQA